LQAFGACRGVAGGRRGRSVAAPYRGLAAARMGDRSSSPGPLKYRLWCGGLHRNIEEDEVRKHMEQYGEVVSVMIRSSPKDTFAFIQFTNKKACDEAIDEMEHSPPSDLGDKVRVALSTPDQKRGGERPPPRRQEDRRGDSPRRPPPPPPSQRDFRDDRRGDARGDDFRGGRRGGDSQDDGYRRGRRDRDDSRDYDRGGPRYDRRRNGDGYSPPPRPPRPTRDDYRRGGGRDDEPPRRRSRSRSDREGPVRMAGKVPVGRHKITIENLPGDMTWSELKDLGRDYGASLTFSRTYRHRGQYYGMLEYADAAEADHAIRELDNRRVQGAKEKLRAYMGPGPGGD